MSVSVEYDRVNLRIIRDLDNKVLIAVPWAHDELVEKVADTLSLHGKREAADRVRNLKAGARI